MFERTESKHVQELAAELGINADDRQLLKEMSGRLDWEELTPLITSLTQPPDSHQAQQKLADILQQTEGGSGFGQLAVMLAAARLTREQYSRLGIPDSIFLDTMGCFPRFLRETLSNTGHSSFDRAFWCWRQLSGRLFRLGVLEFEYCPEGLPRLAGFPELCHSVISVHIPSEIHLRSEEIHRSYELRRNFFTRHGAHICREGIPAATVCSSWLLSPALAALLPFSSGIRQFAEDYNILYSDPDDQSFYTWLFQGKNKLCELPADTSLQRKVKYHLEQGGKIGSAGGRLILP